MSLRHEPTISVVIIGRNSTRHLQRLFREQNGWTFAHEIIFVDAQSTDDSVVQAKSQGWRVIKTLSEPLSPALGRAIGGTSAKGDFILFLDADMSLVHPPSVPRIAGRLHERQIAGAAGHYIDTFPDGTKHPRCYREAPNSQCRSPGGILLLDRRKLIAVGNWNPGVFANEEIELLSRFAMNGHVIESEPTLKCLHYTRMPNRVSALLSYYFPRTERDRQFFGGFGMATAAAFRVGSLPSLIRLYPEPLIFVIGLSTASLSFALSAVLSTACLALTCFLIAKRRSLSHIAILPGVLLQAVVGWLRYKQNGEPKYTELRRIGGA